ARIDWKRPGWSKWADERAWFLSLQSWTLPSRMLDVGGRMPRIRFRIRSLMVATAVIALLMLLVRLWPYAADNDAWIPFRHWTASGDVRVYHFRFPLSYVAFSPAVIVLCVAYCLRTRRPGQDRTQSCPRQRSAEFAIGYPDRSGEADGV